MSHSRRIQSSGVRLPAVSTPSELQTGGGGARVDSATEDVTSESVPYPGIVRDGGQVVHMPSGGDVDLRLVVGGDQDA